MTTLQQAALPSPPVLGVEVLPPAAQIVGDIVASPATDCSDSAAPDLKPTSPPPQLPAAQAEHAPVPAKSQLATHHRILAMDRVWEEQRERSRQGHVLDIVSSGSSTDSDEPPAREPRLLSTVTPTATAKPSPGAYTGTLGQPKSPAAAQAGTPSKRPAHLPTLISKTPVPLPEFPKAAEFRIDPGKPKPKPKSASPSPSASSSSTSSSIPHAGAPKDRAAIRAQALLLTEESVLKRLAQVQASGETPRLAASPSQASARIDDMHFATGGELLARIRQSASGSLGTHLSGPNAKPSDEHEARREDSSSKNEDEEEEDDDDDNEGDDEDDAAVSLVDSRFKSSSSSKQDKNGGLTHALDGRPYYVLPGPDDRDEPSRGALIPTNYQLLPKSPRYICPVRNCRRLLPSIKSLGGHFSAKHCSEKFNDNCDGTLSLLGTYKNANSFSPGLVISQEPPRPDAPPPVEPSLPIWVPQHKRKPDMATGSTSASASSSTTATPPTPAASFDASSSSIPSQLKAPLTEAGQYLHSFLHAFQTIHQREDISYMLQLPRRRDLPSSWINHHRHTMLRVQFYAIALAYIVGDEIRGRKACTQKAHSSWRLSYNCPCIALPNSLPESAKRAFNKEPTCVGCCYYSIIQRQKNPCDWIANGPYRSSSEEAEGRELASRAAVAVDAKRIGKRDASRTAVVSPMAASPAILPQTLAGTREPRLKRPLADASAHAGPAFKAARVSSANLSGPREEASLEMESWEMAPGRLTDETGSENIAFSGAYVTSAQPIDAFHDLGINIVVIKAGSSNRWVMETDKARVCTVAAGKVRVKIGQQTFLLGPNGVFIVRPGQTCLVENRFYFDATIHCFTVKDYELVSEAT